MQPSVIDLIGNNPLIPLRQVVPPDHARVLIKLESAKPRAKKRDMIPCH